MVTFPKGCFLDLRHSKQKRDDERLFVKPNDLVINCFYTVSLNLASIENIEVVKK